MSESVTVTAMYAHAHDAFATVARASLLKPFDLRVLVAIHEHGGSRRTDQLEADMQCDSSAIRRSYPVLWIRDLLTADAGEGTPRPKRGTNTRLTLTDDGRDLARLALLLANDRHEVAA